MFLDEQYWKNKITSEFEILTKYIQSKSKIKVQFYLNINAIDFFVIISFLFFNVVFKIHHQKLHHMGIHQKLLAIFLKRFDHETPLSLAECLRRESPTLC